MVAPTNLRHRRASPSEQEVALGHRQFDRRCLGRRARRRCVTANVSGCDVDARAAPCSRACRPCRGGGCRRPARAARRTSEPVGADRRRSRPARPTPPTAAGATPGRGTEHRTGQDRLRRRDRGVGVAHRRPGDHPALQHDVRPDAEERRVPQHEVGRACRPPPSRPRRRCRGRPPGRSCTWRRSDGPGGCRRRRRRRATRGGAFITCAVCQVRMTTSPMRPIACESEPIIEIAPMSWRMSSAAIVDGRMRLSANARSSAIAGLRWWQTISMSRCSSTVLTVCGRVGFVDDGSTLAVRCDGDDVGRVAAAGALGVVRVDRPAGDGGQRRVDVAGLVERVGVDGDLHARLVGDGEAGVDRRRRRAPVLVQLEAGRPAAQLLPQRLVRRPCCPCRAARR